MGKLRKRLGAHVITIPLMAVVLLLLIPLRETTCALGGCQDIPHYGAAETLEPMMSRNGEQCAADSYVQTNKPYPVDVRSEAYGSCDVYVLNGQTLECILYAQEQRGVVNAAIREDGVAGVTSFSPVVGAPHVFDTRVNGTTTPENSYWYFYTEGLRTLRYRATFLPTTCMMLPEWKEDTRNFNALNCLPVWNKKTSTGPVVHIAPNTISVYIDPNLFPNMQSGIRDAVIAFSTALDPFRGTIALPTFVPTNTLCAGPNCINMRPGTPPDPTACAGGTPAYDPSTGLILSSTIYYPQTSSSATWTLDFIKRLGSHELVHHLGLDDNSSWCLAGPTGSVMRPVNCGEKFGYPTAPTMSDILPTVQSVYGGQPKTTCPKTN